MKQSAHKKAALTAELKRLNSIGDGLGMPIDSGIKKVVALLTLLGFRTLASCEGHMDPKHGTLEPWVDIRAHGAVRKVHKLMSSFYQYVGKREGEYPPEFFRLHIWFFYDHKVFRLQVGQEVFMGMSSKIKVPKPVRVWVYTEKQKVLKKFTQFLEYEYLYK